MEENEVVTTNEAEEIATSSGESIAYDDSEVKVMLKNLQEQQSIIANEIKHLTTEAPVEAVKANYNDYLTSFR